MNRNSNHENLVKIHAVFETEKTIDLIFEDLKGGPIADSKSEQSTQEIDTIRRIMYQTLKGLKHLEDRNIVHRDIKPNNIIFADDSRRVVKIIDLGLAVECNSPGCSVAGTPGFMDPELFTHASISRGKYIQPVVDVFSLGVIFHFYLFGCYVFKGNSKKEILENNKKGDIRLKRLGQMITDIKCEKAFDLLLRMVTKKQKGRISIQEALDHSFFDSFREEGEGQSGLDEKENIPDDPVPRNILMNYRGREKKFMAGLKKSGRSL